MGSNGSFLVWVWGIVTIGVCVLAITLCVFTYNNNKVAFENGYERQTVSGSSSVVWVKAD